MQKVVSNLASFLVPLCCLTVFSLLSQIESLYPPHMGPDVMPLEEFLKNGLPVLDKGIQERIETASSNGNVLRYVCLIDDSRCEVGIQEVPKNSALGRLRGNDNVVFNSFDPYTIPQL